MIKFNLQLFGGRGSGGGKGGGGSGASGAQRGDSFENPIKVSSSIDPFSAPEKYSGKYITDGENTFHVSGGLGSGGYGEGTTAIPNSPMLAYRITPTGNRVVTGPNGRETVSNTLSKVLENHGSTRKNSNGVRFRVSLVQGSKGNIYRVITPEGSRGAGLSDIQYVGKK